MTDNVIKSEDVAPKKTTKPKPKKVESTTPVSGDKVVVYFEGSVYSFIDGTSFTYQNPMKEWPADDAERLFNMGLFRRATDEEKKLYYNSVEA